MYLLISNHCWQEFITLRLSMVRPQRIGKYVERSFFESAASQT